MYVPLSQAYPSVPVQAQAFGSLPVSLSHERILVCCTMWKRKKSRPSHGPGSASLQGMPRHMQYGGSRGLAQRWEYDEGSGAGFVELHPRHTPTDEEFFKMLQQVSGVTHVEWQSSKTSQNNISEGHHFKRNILVQSRLGPESASHPLEFELTRNQHMKDKRLPFTVTACFKEPSPDLVPEAWRILTEVIKGKELAPLHFAQYRARVLDRWENKQLNSQLSPEEIKRHPGPDTSGAVGQDDIEPPGSASGLDVLPHPRPDTSGQTSSQQNPSTERVELQDLSLQVEICDFNECAGDTTGACFWLCLAAGLTELKDDIRRLSETALPAAAAFLQQATGQSLTALHNAVPVAIRASPYVYVYIYRYLLCMCVFTY